MKGANNFESYTGLPATTRLEIQLEGDPADFNAVGEVTDGTNRVRIKESQLLAGFTSRSLEGGTTYFATFRIDFVVDASAVLRVRVRKPNGSLAETTEWDIEGSAGDEPRRGLYLRTA